MKWQTRIGNNFIRSTLHLIAPNIYCVSARRAADANKTADLMSSQLALLRMDTHSQSRVVTAVTMICQMLFWYQGHTGALYMLGGCNVSGCHLFETQSHGSTGKMPFTSSGSGGLAGFGIVLAGWHDRNQGGGIGQAINFDQ
ncbi:hypothetical protein ACA910_011803 [Epithemia clementina (nom. ined.)]